MARFRFHISGLACIAQPPETRRALDPASPTATVLLLSGQGHEEFCPGGPHVPFLAMPFPNLTLDTPIVPRQTVFMQPDGPLWSLLNLSGLEMHAVGTQVASPPRSKGPFGLAMNPGDWSDTGLILDLGWFKGAALDPKWLTEAIGGKLAARATLEGGVIRGTTPVSANVRDSVWKHADWDPARRITDRAVWEVDTVSDSLRVALHGEGESLNLTIKALDTTGVDVSLYSLCLQQPGPNLQTHLDDLRAYDDLLTSSSIKDVPVGHLQGLATTGDPSCPVVRVLV